MALKLESSMTDLMTSLAVVFIMLMLALAQNNARGSITKIEEISKQINKELEKDDLSCVIQGDDPLACTIEVKEDKLKFSTGNYACDKNCENFLEKVFIERIIEILMSTGKYKDFIQGIYIEGFTDDIGDDNANLDLSQNRSLSIGTYILNYYQKNLTAQERYETLLEWLYLIGRGEQDLKYYSLISKDTVWNSLFHTLNFTDHTPNFLDINRDASRRVEITIRVKSNEQRAAIASQVKGLQ